MIKKLKSCLVSLLTLTLQVSCVTTTKIENKKTTNIPVTKYKVGECTYLVDPETGKGNRGDIMKIDSVTKTDYYYRWWVYQGGWALETNIRSHSRYEAMTKPSKCPR